jgi:hypothetical protein
MTELVRATKPRPTWDVPAARHVTNFASDFDRPNLGKLRRDAFRAVAIATAALQNVMRRSSVAYRRVVGDEPGFDEEDIRPPGDPDPRGGAFG